LIFKGSVIILVLLLFSTFLFGQGIFNAVDPFENENPPDPPPDPVSIIIGQDSLCAGDSASYYIDAPIIDSCIWAIDGNQVSSDGCEISIIWNDPGEFLLTVTYVYPSGGSTVKDTLEILVLDVPGQPGSITGDTAVCENTIHTYTTTVGIHDSCEWKVNGIIMPANQPVLNYTFGSQGFYLFEVRAYNDCGFSDYRTLAVQAAGAAPDPPGPVSGAENTCEDYTESYTTSVGPGETCEWRINNVIQPDTGTTLNVTWAESGEQLLEVRAVSMCGTGNPAYQEVFVDFFPDVDLGPDTTILQGHALVLDAGNSGASYLWNTGDTTRQITVTVAGTYSVTATTSCSNDFDLIEVTVLVSLTEIAPEQEITLTNNGQEIHILGNVKVNRVSIFASDGRLVLTAINKKVFMLPVPGIYLMVIESEAGTISEKVFVR